MGRAFHLLTVSIDEAVRALFLCLGAKPYRRIRRAGKAEWRTRQAKSVLGQIRSGRKNPLLGERFGVEGVEIDPVAGAGVCHSLGGELAPPGQG